MSDSLILNRRKALARISALALSAYMVPTVLTISKAKADGGSSGGGDGGGDSSGGGSSGGSDTSGGGDDQGDDNDDQDDEGDDTTSGADLSKMLKITKSKKRLGHAGENN